MLNHRAPLSTNKPPRRTTRFHPRCEEMEGRMLLSSANGNGPVVTSINERLDELEGEKEELEAWSRNDKERRSLMYTLKSREEQEIEAQIKQQGTSKGISWRIYKIRP